MTVLASGRNPPAGSHRRACRIVVIASLTLSLTNFRLELLKRMVEAGHDVVAIAPDDDDVVVRALGEIGVRFVRIPMARAGVSPFRDMQTLFALWRQFVRFKPDIVLPYTMKPIIYGCLAARLSGVPRRIALVTGLGYVFAENTPSPRLAVVRRLSVWLYRLALAGVERVFVYNDADAADILRHRLIADKSLITSVPGSGVDLGYYVRSDLPTGPPVFLLVARLLRDKGILEYVQAVKLLRTRYPAFRAQILGPLDPNPAAISKAEVEAWASEGIVEYLGETRDVRPFLVASSVFVLPSYYREGIPRSILEAMAMGRAVITADTPGCRDTVIDGENGRIVPPRDPEALAEAMEAFLLDPNLAKRMGARSHEIARERFDVHAVNRLLLTSMELL